MCHISGAISLVVDGLRELSDAKDVDFPASRRCDSLNVPLQKQNSNVRKNKSINDR